MGVGGEGTGGLCDGKQFVLAFVCEGMNNALTRSIPRSGLQKIERPRNGSGWTWIAVSRGAYDAQIFTNDREKLGAALGHDVSHSSAHAPEMKPEQKQEQAVTPQREIAPKQEQGEVYAPEQK